MGIPSPLVCRTQLSKKKNNGPTNSWSAVGGRGASGFKLCIFLKKKKTGTSVLSCVQIKHCCISGTKFMGVWKGMGSHMKQENMGENELSPCDEVVLLSEGEKVRERGQRTHPVYATLIMYGA
jgi:hypothetical protein